jgi:hypothetical protein
MTVKDLSLKNEKTTITSQRYKIKVKQYLSLDEKFKIINEVLRLTIDENDFVNILNLQAWKDLTLIRHYTDIDLEEYFNSDDIVEKCKELYDLFFVNNVFEDVFKNIPVNEFNQITEMIDNTVHEFYKYRNSIKGILEAVTADYSDLNLEASEIQKKLNDPENVGFLKEVMNKLG